MAVQAEKTVTIMDGQMAAQETVSTGPELVQWLESHKNTGGTVKLADNVVLDGYYCFCPNRAGTPFVYVETGGHTITVTGEAEFLSTHRLVFMGQPGEKGIFCVKEGGMLTFGGVILDGGQCALWQEEGSGLIVDNCQVTGEVHYAQTPFVMYVNHICAVVQKGQTAADALPARVKCTVNWQGQASYNELLPVDWNLEGMEKQQKERLRFTARGSFSGAASKEPLLCTVAYNDYPLTFTEVKAMASESMYMFRGGYTKPEDSLPVTVISEYSFDGVSWMEYDKRIATHVSDGFFIGLTSEQWDTVNNPHLYIRLQWKDCGESYFSNVLRYAAANLDIAEDQGGTRGGGTSIVNPPDEPQENIPADGPLESEPEDGFPKIVGNESLEEHPTDRRDPLEDEIVKRHADGLSEVSGNGIQETPSGSLQEFPGSETQPSSSSHLPEKEISSGTMGSDTLESMDRVAERPEEISRDIIASSAAEPSVRESTDRSKLPGTQPLQRTVLRDRTIAAVLGITALSFLGGAVVFCFHNGIFSRLFHRMKKLRHKP